MKKRFWSKVDRRGGWECWPWTGATFASGYGAFRLEGKTVRAHRVAYQLSVEALEEDKVILHLCDNPICCNPVHLYQGTQADNLAAAGRKGHMTRAVGANAILKLPPEAIQDIQTSFLSNRALARKYGIGCHKTITQIKEEVPVKQTTT